MNSIWSHKFEGSSLKGRKKVQWWKGGYPQKHEKPLKIKDFKGLVKFWLRQSDVMLRIVMLLTSFAVMWCVPIHARSAHHFRRKHHARSAHHIPLAEHIVEKSTCFRKCFFLAPPAGLEPATSWLTVMRSTDWAKEEYLWQITKIVICHILC